MLEGTRDDLKSRYPDVDVLTIPVDVTDESSVDAAVIRAADQFGRLDIAANCAGIGGVPSRTSDMPLKDWQKVIDINQTGLWLCQRAMIRQMLNQE